MIMPKPEEHYAIGLDLANKINLALGERTEPTPVHEVLALAMLHVELGKLALAMERPGRRLVLPNGGI